MDYFEDSFGNVLWGGCCFPLSALPCERGAESEAESGGVH
jgi:hypothetical protein